MLLSFLPAFLESRLGSTIANAVVPPFTAIAVTLVYFRLTAAATVRPETA